MKLFATNKPTNSTYFSNANFIKVLFQRNNF